jgi:hypothetical protein
MLSDRAKPKGVAVQWSHVHRPSRGPLLSRMDVEPDEQRLWKESHTLGATGVSSRDSFAMALQAMARDCPWTCPRAGE